MSTLNIEQLRGIRASMVSIGETWKQRSNGRTAKIISWRGNDPFYALVEYADGNTNWIPFTGILARWKRVA